ncbi:MAG: MarR family transcriptional regulator [Sphingomonas sp.]
MIRARRLRGQFFRSDLFADPAWDMLLDLYAAHLERRRVSVSSLCIAAAVPPTTALRWIGSLHDAGMFERQADPSDRRRAYIALSLKGLEGMRGFFAAVKRQGLALG